jgi:hypothetical protein
VALLTVNSPSPVIPTDAVPGELELPMMVTRGEGGYQCQQQISAGGGAYEAGGLKSCQTQIST